MNAVRAYLALSPEQKQLLRVKLVEGQFEPRALVALLAPLARFDTVADRLRRWLMIAGVVALVLGAIFFFVAGALPAIVLGGAGAAWVVAAIRLRRIDLSNNLRAAVPFLAVLREEMAPGATVDVRIDLSAPMSAAKQTGKSAPYERAGYRKIVDTVYRDPWFEGRAELVDRSRLAWRVDDRIVESRRQKYNGRKTKYKTKYRKRSRLSVHVGFAAKAYDVAVARTPPTGAEMDVDSTGRRTTFRLVRVVEQHSLDPIDAAALVDLVAQAYRRAAPPRKGASA
jgi:hypothetical protein